MLPKTEDFAAMGAYNEELIKAGINRWNARIHLDKVKDRVHRMNPADHRAGLCPAEATASVPEARGQVRRRACAGRSPRARRYCSANRPTLLKP
ncbi:hypothetical protein ACQPZQ_23730 [Pseudonocardia sp. CA-142604]|uniref:hypothetical protein n=1 Tax=Pseudonocardia sp. CA-142604 TaxID=3240024 RepID=UPI003D8DC595